MSSHANKHIRAAIEYAEECGWEFVKSTARAHSYGALYCSFHGRDGCIVQVFSTPRIPENHAKWLRRQVDRCPHLPTGN
jgi:hypothetical protein